MIIHINGIDREATKDEMAEIEATRAVSLQEALENKQIEIKKQELKTATLAKLGLTVDEVNALFS